MHKFDISSLIIRVTIVANKGTCLLTLCALHALTYANTRESERFKDINPVKIATFLSKTRTQI